MSLDIGYRSRLREGRPEKWFFITAKASTTEEDKSVSYKPKTPWYLYFEKKLHSMYWICTLLISIFINTFICVTYFWFYPHSPLLSYILISHFSCVLYWIDFLGSVIRVQYNKDSMKTRPGVIIPLILDAISLLPLSTMYLIGVKEIDAELLWELRQITVIRYYRIPWFFWKIYPANSKSWISLVISYAFIFIIVIILFSNAFVCWSEGYKSTNLYNWNLTTSDRIITSLYYSCVVVFNVGIGDITPTWLSQLIFCVMGMCFGAAMTMGVLPGIMGSAFTNLTARREQYRYEYEVVKATLRRTKISTPVINAILENMMIMWKYKKGYRGSPPMYILPSSIKSEIFFDINYGLISHSLVFSVQPRYFLRHITMFMKNITHLPGDIVLEPGLSDSMVCIASGIIEVLAVGNDESVLFSLTSGSIIGEVSLFFPQFRLCVLRASTYVELQVLRKVDLTRLALSYPEIFRSMRENVSRRFKLKSKRRNTDETLSKKTESETLDSEPLEEYLENKLTSMYVKSENIPKVKGYPLTLVRARPWILRPDTSLTKFWSTFVAIFVVLTCMLYPTFASFYRKVTPSFYVLRVFTNAIFIIDIYIECTTAIERKDNYTFIVTVKGIIAHKLKTVSFYLDIVSAYPLSIYAPLVSSEHSEYVSLLLSLNVLLKTWRVYTFMKKQENDLRNNLFFITTMKYLIWIAFVLTWAACLLYLEARPGGSYIHDRWFAYMEVGEVKDHEEHPRALYPEVVTFYFSSVIIFLVGYGDIVPRSAPDFIVITICIVSGFILGVLWAVETSAAQKHLTKIRTSYQEEVFAISNFMNDHDIPKDLQERVKTYMQLQWDYDKGYSLRRFAEEEMLLALQKQLIINEIAKTFTSVPVFRTTRSNFLKLLARLSRVRIVPPNEMISEKGSVMRTMHIIESGYCKVTSDDPDECGIMSAVNAYGYIEMILGEPDFLKVETLTHVRVISLTYGAYLMAITEQPSAKIEIESELRKLKKGKKYLYKMAFQPYASESRFSLLSAPLTNKTWVNTYKYHRRISIPYSEAFKAYGKFRFLQYIFCPFVIKPNCTFLKIWMTLRTTSALAIGFLAPIQFSILYNTHEMMTWITALQIYGAIDMYLMFHIAYYNDKGILVYHPAKTVVNYLKGNFILDFISLIPYHHLENLIFPDKVANLFLKEGMGMIIIIQLYKFFQGCHYLEQNIMRKIGAIKVLKLLPLLLIVINLTTGFIILLQCREIYKGDVGLIGKKRLALELAANTQEFCMETVSRNLTMSHRSIYKMYLTTFYWVTTTLTVCGFGDIVPHNETLMILVIPMLILGIFFFTVMFANITSSILNTDVLITAYRKRVLRMARLMKDKQVSYDVQKRLIVHFEYNWKRTEGKHPKVVMYMLNTNLRKDIVKSMYETTINQNSLLQHYSEYIDAALSKDFDEIYFLRGEIIIKYKDILNCIYLIYRGKVNVLSPTGKLLHTMERGAMFGNVSNKAFALSTETMLAVENVDLLMIKTKTFFWNLHDLSGATELITKLTSQTKNYILSKKSEESDTSVHKAVTTNIYSIPWTILQRGGMLTYERNRFGFKGPFAFVFRKQCFTFVILPDNVYRLVFDIIFMLLASVNYCLVLYEFALQDLQLEIQITLYLMDVLFLVKVYLHLHMTESDKYGECLIDIKLIRKKYLNSQLLTYDVLANMPLEILIFLCPRKWWFKLLNIMRLNRLFRFYYIFIFFQTEHKKLMTNRIILQICWTVITIALMIHTLACLWIISVRPLGEILPLTWITEMNLTEIPNWDYYVYSVYHVIVSTTTAGLQVLEIYSYQGIALSVAIMIMCRYAVVLLTSLAMASINADRFHLFKFQERFDELTATFKRQNVSEYILVKMKNYMHNLWNLENGELMPKFIAEAPYCMKCEVMYAMFGHHVSQSYIFSMTDIAFQKQLATHLHRYVYFKGNYIVQQGDIDYTMYFINSGEVSVLTIHPELMETIHYVLKDNDSFGLRQGLVIGKAHKFSYRAETRVEVLLLNHEKWAHLLKYFPEEDKKIHARLATIPA